MQSVQSSSLFTGLSASATGTMNSSKKTLKNVYYYRIPKQIVKEKERNKRYVGDIGLQLVFQKVMVPASNLAASPPNGSSLMSSKSSTSSPTPLDMNINGQISSHTTANGGSTNGGDTMVYVLQDIFGMNQGRGTVMTTSASSSITSHANAGADMGHMDHQHPFSHSSYVPSSNMTDPSESMSGVSGVGNKVAPTDDVNTIPGTGHDFVDTDSEECVICLTDPREVAVYPCRHMCMCTTCADALPAGNNKCPLCRREAFLLIK